MEENIHKIYAILFSTIIAVFSVISMLNLWKFYAYDEVNYNDWSVDVGGKVETDFTTNFCAKELFVDFNGAVRSLLNQKVMNNIVKLNNGRLSGTQKRVPEEYIISTAENTYNLQSKLGSREIEFLYVLTPFSIPKYDSQLPTGVEDFSNDNADRFVAELEKLGVEYLDLREEMHKDGIDQFQLWFRTDHHWNMSGGFYGFNKILEKVENLINFQFDSKVKDMENYEVKEYPSWFLGTNGQRTGKYFTGVDDFGLFVPRFNTSIMPSGGEAGSLEEQIYNFTPLQKPDYRNLHTYDRVLDGTQGHFINLECKNDKKIVFICDSMGNTINPFLILSFKEMYTISAYEPSKLNADFLESFQPDIVVMMHYPHQMGNIDAFTFDLE